MESVWILEKNGGWRRGKTYVTFHFFFCLFLYDTHIKLTHFHGEYVHEESEDLRFSIDSSCRRRAQLLVLGLVCTLSFLFIFPEPFLVGMSGSPSQPFTPTPSPSIPPTSLYSREKDIFYTSLS